LNSTAEVFDSELFAIWKSLQEIKSNISSNLNHIWIFSDSMSAIQRISNNSSRSDQEISYKIQLEDKLLFERNIQLHIQWISDHFDIFDNEMTDNAAKRDAFNQSSDVTLCEMSISLISFKRNVKESLLQMWHSIWQHSTKKRRTYQNLNTVSMWKSFNLDLHTSRIVWSSYIQLKLSHDYFKSYLKRLSDFDSDKCDCNNISVQSSAHLLLSYSKYQSYHAFWQRKLKVSSLSLTDLFCSFEEVKLIFDFLSKTEIAWQNWL
jgi:hypothetical protein